MGRTCFWRLLITICFEEKKHDVLRKYPRRYMLPKLNTIMLIKDVFCVALLRVLLHPYFIVIRRGIFAILYFAILYLLLVFEKYDVRFKINVAQVCVV